MSRNKRFDRTWKNTKAAVGITATIVGSLSGPPLLPKQMNDLGRRSSNEAMEIRRTIEEAVRSDRYGKRRGRGKR
jgi:hypothetical protein